MFHLLAGNDTLLPTEEDRGEFTTLEAAWIVAKGYHWARLTKQDDGQPVFTYAILESYITKETIGFRILKAGWRLFDGSFVDMEKIEEHMSHEFLSSTGSAIVPQWVTFSKMRPKYRNSADD